MRHEANAPCSRRSTRARGARQPRSAAQHIYLGDGALRGSECTLQAHVSGLASSQRRPALPASRQAVRRGAELAQLRCTEASEVPGGSRGASDAGRATGSVRADAQECVSTRFASGCDARGPRTMLCAATPMRRPRLPRPPANCEGAKAAAPPAAPTTSTAATAVFLNICSP